jgi:CheY-like chemotaxis protein
MAMSGKRILIVEDEPDSFRLAKLALEAVGHQVLRAEDGQTGLELARSEQPALILMDLMLPVLNGFEAIRALRADPTTRAIPIVVLSAKTGPDTREKAFAAGCDDYLTKPWRIKQLRDMVARWVAHR